MKIITLGADAELEMNSDGDGFDKLIELSQRTPGNTYIGVFDGANALLCHDGHIYMPGGGISELLESKKDGTYTAIRDGLIQGAKFLKNFNPKELEETNAVLGPIGEA